MYEVLDIKFPIESSQQSLCSWYYYTNKGRALLCLVAETLSADDQDPNAKAAWLQSLGYLFIYLAFIDVQAFL